MPNIGDFFNILLYRPLLNFLILLYLFLPGKDFGVAIIFLTLIIKTILFPLEKQTIISQKKLVELQPKIQAIKEKYKNNKEEQIKEILELYKKEKISPFSGFLSMLIQFPILIALYQVFWKGFQADQMKNLYFFMPQLNSINFYFLGFLDLSKPNMYLAILTGVFQFIQLKRVSKSDKSKKSNEIGEIIQKQTIYFFPIFTIFVLLKLPSAIGLYWITITIFSIIQQYFIYKKISY